MIFTPHHCQLIENDEKTVTRRPMSSNPASPWSDLSCGLVVGQTYAVQPGRNLPALGRLEVVRVDDSRLGDVDDDEAVFEGYPSRAAFVAAWEEIHGEGSWDDEQRVWRVEFKAVKDA